MDSESSDGKVWPEDEDELKGQPSDYEMEDAEELDETVSKKQLNRKVSTSIIQITSIATHQLLVDLRKPCW